MTKIRVLRLLEYIYEDAETAAADMTRWTNSLNTGKMVMKSATLPFEVVPFKQVEGE